MSSSLERASHDFYVPADGAFTTSLVEEELEPDIKRTGSFEIARQFQEARISISKSNRTGTATEEDEKFNKLRHIDEHIIPLEDLLARYDSDPSNGLTSAKAAANLARDGPNSISPPAPTPQIIVYLGRLTAGFSSLMWIGAFLCIIAYFLNSEDKSNLYLAIVLVITVVVTATFEHIQDAKASRVMDKFKNMVPQVAIVIRDGKRSDFDASKLVVGDLVELSIGNKVPADVRVIESSNLKVDNSSLTGETDPQARSTETTDDNPLETKNLAFYSTSIIEGNGLGIVVNTGDRTIIGQIANLACATSGGDTPIRKEIKRFVHIISFFAIIMGCFFFFVGLIYFDIVTDIIYCIGITVANVPEGLTATVTLLLTLGSKRMAKKKVLVKNLESVETLGSTTTICSDKTGTLTQNKMTVMHLWVDDEIHTTNSVTTSASYDTRSAAFLGVVQSCSLCTNARFKNSDVEDEGKLTIMRDVTGDGSECALVKFVHEIRPLESARAASPRVTQIPFNSTNKFHVSVHKEEGIDDGFLMLMKGAPERVIARCSKILINGVEEDLDDHWMARFQKAYDELGGKGERVLGHCKRRLDLPDDFQFDPDGPNFPLDGMVFTGLTALIDPPRAAVPQAVLTCRGAGIQVVMVTGDHPITAAAIARQVNILDHDDITASDFAKQNGLSLESVIDQGPTEGGATAIVVAGSELLEMSDETLDKVIKFPHIVFARTSPEQKLQIVSAFQRRGEIVAVTGDGVNDSPALKKADIGVAMGITGSEVSQEAADMILLDDNFASIVKGIEEGRLIFDNLKKSIAYVLTHAAPEIMPFFCFLLIRLPIPLTTMLVLCIDLGSDMVPAISLAHEPAESNIMKRKPRNPQKDHLVGAVLMCFSYLQMGMIEFIGTMYAYFVVFGDFGFSPLSLVGGAKYFTTEYEDETILFGNRRYTYDERINANMNANTAVFVAIVIMQWGNVIACKTRFLSLFQQGMRNKMLTLGMMFNFFIIIIVTYCPGIDVILGSRPLHPRHLLPAIPFSIALVCYDEMRKFFIRKYPGGWVERRTLY
eukprot:TRINITY_DN770_c0_g1_i1.p1 TRINITY_DN770_c0_g1~~TRINITY_DN770_c0_g1_i1.p1  ORF type:complete len:1051 (-),score=455.74 TRINITY_DN770_c0_g1_i1:24-3176(-)